MTTGAEGSQQASHVQAAMPPQPQGTAEPLGVPPPRTREVPTPPAHGGQQAAPPAPGASPASAPGSEPAFDKDGMLHVPKKDFNKRVAKMSRRELREIFGTGDVDKIKLIKTQWDEWKAKEDERLKAEMTVQQRLQAERDEALARAKESDERMSRAKHKVRVMRLERRMGELAELHVDPKMLDAAIAKFSEYVKENPRKARRIAKRGDDGISRWFQELASRSPKYAREGGSAAASSMPELSGPPQQGGPPAPPQRVTNGLPPRSLQKPPTASAVTNGLDANGLYKGKNPRQGLPNSMTAAEVKSMARELNLPWHE